MNFDIAFERLIGHEGGYVNHPEDPGGETNWGITLRTAREAGYTGSMRDLTRDQAKEIYRTAYWGRAQAEQYDGAIAFQVFDAAVNHGIGQARRHTDLPPRASPRRNDPKGCGSLTSTPSLPSFQRTSVESPITRPHQG